MNRPFDAEQYVTGMAEHELGARASDIRVDEGGVAPIEAMQAGSR